MKALVLSGGGAYGAFEVGVIKRLTELGHRWDLICGVSVGAINSLNMAMYPIAQQDEGAQALEQFWFAIRGNQDIYQNWTIPILEGVFARGGIYDTSPLEHYIRSRFQPVMLSKSGVILRVGTTGLRSGQLTFGSEKSDDVVKWVMASAAFPGAFPPIQIGDEKYIDGGVREAAPIAEAITLGATDLDIVLCGPKDGESHPWNLSEACNAALVGIRAADIMANQVFIGDQDVLKNFKGTYRIYAPYAPWDTDPLMFDPQAIRHMIDVGYGIP